MEEIKLNIHPFKMDTLKEAAKKVQEEAGEAFAEYVILQERPDRSTTRLADEIADTIQASCNLAARYDLNLQAAMQRCEQRNRERGRYPMEEKDVEPCRACVGDVCNCGGDCGAVPVGVDNLRQKSPEEMSVEELIEALNAANICDDKCKEILGVDWCENFNYCSTCRKRLLDMLKETHERKTEEAIELIKDGRDEYMRLRTENGIMLDELLIRQDRIDELNQQVSDLTNERDGLKRRLEELSDAGITELYRLLRKTMGKAKNVTDTARNYAERERKAREGSKEREAVIERLRELDFSNMVFNSNVALSKIGYAILGDSAPWYPALLTTLRDKLIEMISDGAQDD